MEETDDRIIVPPRASYGVSLVSLTPGAAPLENQRHEVYCRERSLLRSRAESYRTAGFAAKDDDTAAGNAAALERRSDVQARLAYLQRDEEHKHREARRRLEEKLWQLHDVDIGDYIETVEIAKKTRKGEPILDREGNQVIETKARLKPLHKLTPEQRRCIEGITINESGLPFPKLHSATWANEQLRKLHNIGPTPKEDIKSEENVLEKIAELANRLGVKIDMSIE